MGWPPTHHSSLVEPLLSIYYVTNTFSITGFLKFEVGELEAFLGDTNLNIQSEVQAFNALITWINYSKDERAKHVKVLMSNIKLPLLPKCYLMEHVMKQELLQQDGE